MNVTLDRLLEFIGNHWMMAGGLFITAVLLVEDIVNSMRRKHKMVSPTEAVVFMNDEQTVVIDLRDPNEYVEGHIEGARNIPLLKLEERAFELEAYKQKPVIVTCQSGMRSPEGSRKLVALGFTQVLELKGGLVAWEDQKLPITKKRGKK